MTNVTTTKELIGYHLIDSTNNSRIFSVKFIKKDGTIRTMLARRGVRKNIKGVGMAYRPLPKGLLTVFDMHKGQYRHINLTTLLSFKANGIEVSLKAGGNNANL